MRAPSRRNRPGPGRCHPSGRPPSSCCELLQATAFGKGRRRWRARRVSPPAGPGPAPPYLQREGVLGWRATAYVGRILVGCGAPGRPQNPDVSACDLQISMTTLRRSRRGTTSANQRRYPCDPLLKLVHTHRAYEKRQLVRRATVGGGPTAAARRARGTSMRRLEAPAEAWGIAGGFATVARAHSDARKLANERVASPLQAKAFQKSSWHRPRPPAAPPCGRFAWAIPVCGRGAPPYSRGASASAP